jgi:hypothetical protein
LKTASVEYFAPMVISRVFGGANMTHVRRFAAYQQVDAVSPEQQPR